MDNDYLSFILSIGSPGDAKTDTAPTDDTENTDKATEGIGALQRIADNNKKDIERSRLIELEYQNNIKLSEHIQVEISKGILNGENIYSLFLKAIKVISLMTDNEHYYDKTAYRIKTLYGYGLGELYPLQQEIEDARGRLQKLTEARQNATDNNIIANLDNALEAHRELIQELEKRINQQ